MDVQLLPLEASDTSAACAQILISVRNARPKDPMAIPSLRSENLIKPLPSSNASTTECLKLS